MRKFLIAIVCLFGLASCGSTAPCGLSKANNTKYPQNIDVADATQE